MKNIRRVVREYGERYHLMWWMICFQYRFLFLSKYRIISGIYESKYHFLYPNKVKKTQFSQILFSFLN